MRLRNQFDIDRTEEPVTVEDNISIIDEKDQSIFHLQYKDGVLKISTGTTDVVAGRIVSSQLELTPKSGNVIEIQRQIRM